MILYSSKNNNKFENIKKLRSLASWKKKIFKMVVAKKDKIVNKKKTEKRKNLKHHQKKVPVIINLAPRLISQT